ncbi:MAG: phosphoribosylglycinamide formyltransferase [Actinobacteria bacterium]|nr:phosphoribosylglycinamide formyltransferase [Actinomycetota bacterium]
MKKVVILASGSGTLARAIFAAEKDYEITALICDRPQAKVIEIANEFGIKVESLELIGDRAKWDQELLSLASKHQPDLVVSAGFMRILAPQFVQKFKVINSHPALLPLFPGAHAVRDALAAGAIETGTTIHWVDEGVDTGEVIAQERVEITPTDTVESLHERIKIIERGLIVATIPQVLAGLK